MRPIINVLPNEDSVYNALKDIALHKERIPLLSQQSVEYIDLEKQLEGCSETQLKILAAITGPNTHIDDIIDASGLDSQTVLAELTMLQIDGMVTQEPGKRFSLNIVRS